MANESVGSGGFTTGLRTTDYGITPEANYLASEQQQVKRAGATYAASTVVANGSGDKVIKAGTLVTPITSVGADQGKFGPYDLGATDGRQTLDPDISGYCPVSINLRYGDVVEGVQIGGSVLKARVVPSTITTAIRTALGTRFTFQ